MHSNSESLDTKLNVIPNWDDVFQSSLEKVDAETHDRINKLRNQNRKFIMNFGSRVARRLNDPSFEKFADISWPELVEFLSTQYIENHSLKQNFPHGVRDKQLQPLDLKSQFKINRRFSQLPCTRHTVDKRVEQARRFCQKDDPILLLGDDDFVSLALAQSGFKNIHVADIDKNVIATIHEISEAHQYEIKTYLQDFSEELPEHFPKECKMVFFDPFYSLEGVELFLNVAKQATSGATSPVFFLSVHLMSLMKDGATQLEGVFSKFGVTASEFHPSFNVYPVPQKIRMVVGLVNKAIVRERIIKSERDTIRFFTSDAFILRKSHNSR